MKYEYAELTNQMAEHMGFTADEQRMLTMFWAPAFNSGWIYLSDEIILDQMTNEIGKDDLVHFYKRVLLNGDYVKNADYKNIGETHELIQKSANKKGKAARQYYRKVEQLAIFMKYYIVELHKHILKKQIDDQKKIIEEKDAILNRLHIVNTELITFKKLTEKREHLHRGHIPLRNPRNI